MPFLPPRVRVRLGSCRGRCRTGSRVRRVPDRAARVLLTVIERDPEAGTQATSGLIRSGSGSITSLLANP